MEELDIKDLISYFMSKFVYFFMIIAFVVCVGCVYIIFFQKPLYTSKTSVILTGNSNNDSSTSITQTDLNVNSKLVSTYKEIVKSKKVLNQVVMQLGLEYSAKDLSSMIKVGAINDTEIIEISVTHEDNYKAYNIANVVANVFSKEAKELYNLSNVAILDLAEVENVPSNINVTKQMLLFFAIGCALAFCVLFLFYYFDTTLKSISDIERRYALPILGAVPDYTKKKNRGGKRK